MDSITLAEYVERWRSVRGISQNALMAKAGLAGTFMTDLGRGADAKLSSLDKLATAMDMTLPELLTEAGLAHGVADVERHDVIRAVQADPDLLPEAKQHLVNQYGLLLRVQQQQAAEPTDGPGLRAVARKRGDRKSDGKT